MMASRLFSFWFMEFADLMLDFSLSLLTRSYPLAVEMVVIAFVGRT